MRLPFTNKSDPDVNEQIRAVLEQMTAEGVESEEYSKYLTSLERLYSLRTEHRHPKVSRDAMAQIVGNLAGILIIVVFEQRHTITSKAFGEIIRARRS